MFRSSIEHALMGLAVVVVLGCTVSMASMRAAPEQIATLLPAAGSSAPGYRAAVVFQVADCRSGMRFLRVFQDSVFRDLPVQGLMVGDEEDLAYAERRLARDGTPMKVHVADRRLRRMLRRLGHDHTPVVLVLDAGGGLQWVARAPQSDSDMTRLRMLLQAATNPGAS